MATFVEEHKKQLLIGGAILTAGVIAFLIIRHISKKHRAHGSSADLRNKITSGQKMSKAMGTMKSTPMTTTTLQQQ